MILEGKDNLLTPEEEIEAEETFDFMVEDKDNADVACLTCASRRVGNRVCGIFKPYNDFITGKGKPSIEDSFSCSEYKEAN